MIGESLLIVDAFLNLLLGHLATGDAVVGIGGTGAGNDSCDLSVNPNQVVAWNLYNGEPIRTFVCEA